MLPRLGQCGEMHIQSRAIHPAPFSHIRPCIVGERADLSHLMTSRVITCQLLYRAIALQSKVRLCQNGMANDQAFEYKCFLVPGNDSRYIRYEENLEALRVHRKAERGMAAKHTLSEWAIPRRIHFIYDRALRRFKGDLDLWTRWLQHCRAAGSPRQMSKVLTRESNTRSLPACFSRLRPCSCEAFPKVFMNSSIHELSFWPTSPAAVQTALSDDWAACSAWSVRCN